MAPTANRWRALCDQLGASRTEAETWYQALVTAHAARESQARRNLTAALRSLGAPSG